MPLDVSGEPRMEEACRLRMGGGGKEGGGERWGRREWGTRLSSVVISPGVQRGI